MLDEFSAEIEAWKAVASGADYEVGLKAAAPPRPR